jgi:hypothetical protein
MKRNGTIVAICMLLLGALWFGAVDWSWYVHECPDCGFTKDVTQYRLFAIPIHETVYEHPTIVQRVASDLRVPCRHDRSRRWHKHRWWGLLVCRSPCINGTYRLTADDSWYNNDTSAKIAALATADPSIGPEFERRVLNRHEYDFFQSVLDRANIDRQRERDVGADQ